MVVTAAQVPQIVITTQEMAVAVAEEADLVVVVVVVEKLHTIIPLERMETKALVEVLELEQEY
jgi:hypothetical protein